MVHHRLNEKETNPNPHINFIAALRSYDPAEQENAHQLLRALAAQVRPIMKSHGLEVNSLEEYEHNQVFLGRNWNNGETVEIVLRGAGGMYYPTSMLMSTLCHELAHIKHMNHGPAFQALWKRLRTEVRQLQDRGYYGDGYWSSGTRLADSARVDGDGIEVTDIPEYMCGGAHTRTRPTSVRRRRGPTGKRREVVPSLHTGRQTARQKKPGSRVTSKYAFTGEGNMLADGADDVKGKGKGKQATSKRAREERALAVEKRLQALQAQTQGPSASKASTDEEEEDSGDDEVEIVGETNEERRERLLFSSQGENLNSLKFGTWRDFDDDFNFSSSQREGDDTCDVSAVSSGSTFTDRSAFTNNMKEVEETKPEVSRARKPMPSCAPSISAGKKSLSSLAKSEIDLRKELLGMAPVKGRGRILGQPPTLGGTLTPSSTRPKPRSSTSSEVEWDCLVCTLKNQPLHLACSACSTPRGKSTLNKL